MVLLLFAVKYFLLLPWFSSSSFRLFFSYFVCLPLRMYVYVATTSHQRSLRRKRPNEASGDINQSRDRIFSPITGLVILANQNRRAHIYLSFNLQSVTKFPLSRSESSIRKPNIFRLKTLSYGFIFSTSFLFTSLRPNLYKIPGRDPKNAGVDLA